jgi:hypothetical protein
VVKRAGPPAEPIFPPELKMRKPQSLCLPGGLVSCHVVAWLGTAWHGLSWHGMSMECGLASVAVGRCGCSVRGMM